MRRENVTVQGSRASGLPPRAVSPRVEPPNKGKLRAERLSSPCPEDDRDLPVTGPDDYNGALSDESDHVEESQSDGGQGNESSNQFPPSSPTRSKPSASLKQYVHISTGDIVVDTVLHSVLQGLVVWLFLRSLKIRLSPWHLPLASSSQLPIPLSKPPPKPRLPRAKLPHFICLKSPLHPIQVLSIPQVARSYANVLIRLALLRNPELFTNPNALHP
jgi:hypothetical protein